MAKGTALIGLGVLFVLASFYMAYEALLSVWSGSGVKWPLDVNVLKLIEDSLGISPAWRTGFGMSSLFEAGVLCLLLLLANAVGSGLIYLGLKEFGRRPPLFERLIKEHEG